MSIASWLFPVAGRILHTYVRHRADGVSNFHSSYLFQHLDRAKTKVSDTNTKRQSDKGAGQSPARRPVVYLASGG
jgi:hypothetical protein